ncbi:MAG: class I SAM-dependent methyltransferase [Bacteroidales bacterium]|nr:class I SAM-dependent methyltransferase [Bacteroidales bacterium]
MSSYYTENLSGKRLKRCYEIAPSRIQQYMNAEFEFVLSKINNGDKVLDLGCGYGRIIPDLLQKAGLVFGIDISLANISYGKYFLHGVENCVLMEMDAAKLSFPDNIFDVVICIQNGISAFKVEPSQLLSESIRVTKPGGKILFSTYSPKIWNERLDWFRLQADEGLLGEIDEEKTGNGVIICKDGFKATTFNPDGFRKITANLDAVTNIVEIDESSLFCEITA